FPVMREHLLFSPCGHLPLGPESLELLRKRAAPCESSEIPQTSNESSPLPIGAAMQPRECSVCGAPASGYNYEAVSCASCKSFFRRAVLAKRRIRCKEGGQCNDEALLKCRACRFNRCIEAGMNPRAIDIGNVEAVRLARKQLQQSKRPAESPPKLLPPPLTAESTMDRLIDDLLHLEVAYDRIRRSNYKPEGVTIDVCLEGHSRLGIDYGVAPPRDRPHDKPRWKFVPMKVRIRDRIPMKPPAKLCELSECNHPPPMWWPHLDMVHTIEYFKTFDFFHKLPEADKKSLVKQSSLITSYLTNSFNSFEQRSDVTRYPDGAIPHSGQILQWNESDAHHDREIHYETVERVRKLAMDRSEFVLLKAILACNPAVADLSATSQHLLQLQRELYAKALMSYVMARRRVEEGPTAFAAIMAHVEWLTRLVKRNKDLHILLCSLGLNYAKMSTLVNEIYGS
ncbi:hypothetical protein PMAYCL1PPCAC_03365, partial [Pristionchus mayeri]